MECTIHARDMRTNAEWLRLLKQLGEPVVFEAAVPGVKGMPVYKWKGEGEQPDKLVLRKIGQTVLE